MICQESLEMSANQMGERGDDKWLPRRWPSLCSWVHTVSGEPHNSNVFHAHIDPYCPPSPPNKPSFQGLQITSLITMNEFI